MLPATAAAYVGYDTYMTCMAGICLWHCSLVYLASASYYYIIVHIIYIYGDKGVLAV